MTDGILLAEIQGDPLLRRYDTHHHRRGARAQPQHRLPARLAEAHPPEAPGPQGDRQLGDPRDRALLASSSAARRSIQVEGRTFPVDVLYEPPRRRRRSRRRRRQRGRERARRSIRAATSSCSSPASARSARPRTRSHARELRAHRGPAALRAPLGRRAGARLRQHLRSGASSSRPTSPRRRSPSRASSTSSTPASRASRATTRARARRACRSSRSRRPAPISARAAAAACATGVCFRLYDEQSFAARPAFTDPEIKRAGLAGVILRMKSLGLGDVEDFPFLDPPQPRAIAEGYRVLEELGALDGARRASSRRSASSSRASRSTRASARMILAGAERRVPATRCSSSPPRSACRTRASARASAQQKADELAPALPRRGLGLRRAAQAVGLRARGASAEGRSQLRRVCRENFLSFLRVREWTRDPPPARGDACRELRLPTRSAGGANGAVAMRCTGRSLTGPPVSKIGKWNPEQRIYMGARQTRFVIHPSSALAQEAARVGDGVRAGRDVAALRAHRGEDRARSGSRRRRPTCSSAATPSRTGRRSPARASVKEHATLFGLSVARDRSVDYATVAPAEARRMFLDHALVRGEYQHARRVPGEEPRAPGARSRGSATRRGAATCSPTTTRCSRSSTGACPTDVVNGKTFEAWREKAEKDDPTRSVLSLEDVLAGDAGLSPERLPGRHRASRREAAADATLRSRRPTTTASR